MWSDFESMPSFRKKRTAGLRRPGRRRPNASESPIETTRNQPRHLIRLRVRREGPDFLEKTLTKLNLNAAPCMAVGFMERILASMDGGIRTSAGGGSDTILRSPRSSPNG